MSPPLEKCSPCRAQHDHAHRGRRRRAPRRRGAAGRAARMETTLNGGRSRTMSARSRAASISTRKPSRSVEQRVRGVGQFVQVHEGSLGWSG